MALNVAEPPWGRTNRVELCERAWTNIDPLQQAVRQERNVYTKHVKSVSSLRPIKYPGLKINPVNPGLLTATAQWLTFSQNYSKALRRDPNPAFLPIYLPVQHPVLTVKMWPRHLWCPKNETFIKFYKSNWYNLHLITEELFKAGKLEIPRKSKVLSMFSLCPTCKSLFPVTAVSSACFIKVSF